MKCESCGSSISKPQEWQLNICELGKINGYFPEAHAEHRCNPNNNRMFPVHAVSECLLERERLRELLRASQCWIVGHWPEGAAHALAAEIRQVLKAKP